MSLVNVIQMCFFILFFSRSLSGHISNVCCWLMLALNAFYCLDVFIVHV